MTVDVTADVNAGSAAPTRRARWMTAARLAWPVVTILAITANVLVLPEYTRSLLTRTIRAELPAAHLTPAEYMTIEICLGTVFTLVCLVVATVIYIRAAREPVALFCSYTLVALGLGIGSFLSGLTITNPAANALSVTFTAAAQVMGGWFFLVFPSGKFVPRWSRWCVLAAAVGVLAVAASDMARVQPISNAVQPIGVGLLLLGTGAQVYRYRRVSTLTERQQTKWVVFGLAACIAVFVAIELLGLLVTLVAPSARHSQATGNLVVGGLWILGVAFIPVCIGIAVLRTHLWDIGLVISRTLTYAVVTALLAGVYSGLVLMATRVLPFHTTVAVAVSTLTVAALFNPLRRRIQHAVDRRFNRARYDADLAVAAFAARLQDAADPDTVHARLLAAVHQTLEPAHASVWVRPPFGGLLRRVGERDPSKRGAVAVVPDVVVHRVAVRSAGLVLVRVDVWVAWFAGRDLDRVRGWSAACAVFAGQVEDAMAVGVDHDGIEDGARDLVVQPVVLGEQVALGLGHGI